MKKYLTIVTLAACLLLVTQSYSQITNLTTTATGANEYVGWNNAGTSKALDIKNNSLTANNIDFYISSTKFLEVLTSGDLNLVVGTSGYKIGNNYVLRNNNNTSDIFVGVGVGNATMSGHFNTLVG